MAAQVGGDRVPAQVGEVVEEVGEVLLGPGEAVDEHERTSAGTCLRDRQLHAARAHASNPHRHLLRPRWGNRTACRTPAAPVGWPSWVGESGWPCGSRIRLDTVRWAPGTAVWAGAALVVIVGGIAISALRWQRVALALGLDGRLLTMFSWYLAGYFVGSFLPSTVGGDVLRVARLTKRTGDSAAAFAS
ncbi:MAG: hypothetical protein C4344_07455, partial [Acidimicrobiia bacterium]